MSNLNPFMEDNLSVNSGAGQAALANLTRIQEQLQSRNLNLFRDAAKCASDENYMSIIQEAAKLTPDVNTSKYVKSDIDMINVLQENVGRSIFNESVGTSAVSPIVMNSFGIQERALIAAHLPKAVKIVTATKDSFKLTERKPFIIDLAGNKYTFIEAFVDGTKSAALLSNLREKIPYEFTIGDTEIDLYTVLSVDKNRVFGLDSTMKSFGVKDHVTDAPVPASDIVFLAGGTRTPDPETGMFSAKIRITDSNTVTHDAAIMGEFDFSNGKLTSLTSTDPKVEKVTFDIVISPETHHKSLSVGYDMGHTPVHIPVGNHFEYTLSEEYRDATNRYYNIDAMAQLTNDMGEAVEQVKDMSTLEVYKELEAAAVLNTYFDCNPATGFSQGREEYFKREFLPFVERVCITLKDKVKIPNAHFRAIGNPMDIRLAGVNGVEYIYKRGEQFMGNITLDYDFGVTSDVHKVFYISSDRMPRGKVYVFLIPNTITNNISTVNHYEYATYVSNKYKSAKGNLPATMLSTRYLTKEYYPVIAIIEVRNNDTEVG